MSEKSIMTYETHKRAFLVVQCGWTPIYEAYRIKDYTLRRVRDIKTHSLRRLERAVSAARNGPTDCSEHWFRSVWYL